MFVSLLYGNDGIGREWYSEVSAMHTVFSKEFTRKLRTRSRGKTVRERSRERKKTRKHEQ